MVMASAELKTPAAGTLAPFRSKSCGGNVHLWFESKLKQQENGSQHEKGKPLIS